MNTKSQKAQSISKRMTAKGTDADRYQQFVAWITVNDECGEMDITIMEDIISVVMVADVFDFTPRQVANDVMAVRAFADKMEQQTAK